MNGALAAAFGRLPASSAGIPRVAVSGQRQVRKGKKGALPPSAPHPANVGAKKALKRKAGDEEERQLEDKEEKKEKKEKKVKRDSSEAVEARSDSSDSSESESSETSSQSSESDSSDSSSAEENDGELDGSLNAAQDVAQEEEQVETRRQKNTAQDVVMRSKLTEAERLAVDQKTVFFGNLPVALGIKGLRKEIRALFRTGGVVDKPEAAARDQVSPSGDATEQSEFPFGKIVTMRFRGAAIDKTMPARAAYATNTFQSTRDSLLAYVLLNSSEEARHAAERFNGVSIGGHRIRVDVAAFQNHRSFDAARSVFVGNVPFHASEQALHKHFSSIMGKSDSQIVNVRIVRDKETQLGSGIAYVVFSDASSVERAIEKVHGSTIDPALLPAVPADNEELTKAASHRRTLRVTKCTKKESMKKQASASRGMTRGASASGRGSMRGSARGSTRGSSTGARGGSTSVEHGRWRENSSERPAKFQRSESGRGGPGGYGGRGLQSFMGQKAAPGHDSMRNIKETKQLHKQQKAARGGGGGGGGRGRGRGGSRGGSRGRGNSGGRGRGSR